MLSKEKVMSFVSTADAEKARSFYEDSLGLEFVRDDGPALVFELYEGGTLRVQKVPGFESQQQTVLGWHVQDIRSTISGLNKKGVEFLRYPMFEQDDLGIWTTNGALIAWFNDPDGNVISLTQTTET